jgi:hypothetical protein
MLYQIILIGMNKIKPFKFLQTKQTIRWRTSNGLTHPLEFISVDHITNIIRCMNGEGNMRIPNPYEGRTHTDIKEFIVPGFPLNGRP